MATQIHIKQKIKLPTLFDDLFIKPFSEGKIVHIKEIGYFVVERSIEKIVPGYWEQDAPIIKQRIAASTISIIIFRPGDTKEIRYPDSILIEEFSFPIIAEDFKPNTGLTDFVDKKGKLLFTANWRIEHDGKEKVIVPYVGSDRSYKELSILKAYCDIEVEDGVIVMKGLT
jgi:hypothetical protein